MKRTGTPRTIEFNRPKKYRFIEILGRGACGETAHLHDEDMNVDVVAKKYCPQVSKESQPQLFAELMQRFRDEARILFQLNHPNVVRVFNFYDYSEHSTSYIVMEHVSGLDIVDYLKSWPVEFETIFEKVVGGFEYLERKGILHRDIRPNNLLVTTNGEPKIIDFGFGKMTSLDTDQADKSISLNWWCETPPEFEQAVYDSQTEVYFIGKLFERILTETSLTGTKYSKVIAKMCTPSRLVRYESFSEIFRVINEELFESIEFDEDEIATYRMFADQLAGAFSKIELSATYVRDASTLIEDLESLYKSVMLEQFLPDPAILCRIFVKGGFRYYKNTPVEVELLDKFIRLLKGLL